MYFNIIILPCIIALINKNNSKIHKNAVNLSVYFRVYYKKRLLVLLYITNCPKRKSCNLQTVLSASANCNRMCTFYYRFSDTPKMEHRITADKKIEEYSSGRLSDSEETAGTTSSASSIESIKKKLGIVNKITKKNRKWRVIYNGDNILNNNDNNNPYWSNFNFNALYQSAYHETKKEDSSQLATPANKPGGATKNPSLSANILSNWFDKVNNWEKGNLSQFSDTPKMEHRITMALLSLWTHLPKLVHPSTYIAGSF